MSTSRKWLRYFLAASLVVGLVLVAPRLIVHVYASYIKAGVDDRLSRAKTDQDKVEEFARWAAGYWSFKDGYESPWQKLLRIPKPFRPDRHAVDLLSAEGWCNQLVSAAHWLFNDTSRLVQHDLVFPAGGHSAISVRLESGRWVYIDPFYGWMFKDKGRLLGLSEIKRELSGGRSFETLAVPLKANARQGVYADLAEAFDARSFEPMDIRIRLPVDGKESWSAGTLDGDWRDVAAVGRANRMTSHFFYVGARFTTRFRFTYILPGDGRSYELLIHLTKPPGSGELPEFSVAPVIEGRTLRFRFPPPQRSLRVDSAGIPDGVWYPIDRFEVVAARQ